MSNRTIQIATRCVGAGMGQDQVFARVFDEVTIVAIADGVGGSAGGKEAAQLVIRETAKIAPQVRDPRNANFWADWLTSLDILVDSDPQAGETAAVIAAIGSDFVAGASVGDSSAWLISAEDWLDLTEGQNRKPLLGWGTASPMPFSAHPNGQTLLLASDGLTKYATWQRIVDISRGVNLEVAADDLISAVRLSSGDFFDDVSCILCRGR